MGQDQQKTDQAMLHKRNTEYFKGIRDQAHNSPENDNSTLFRRKNQIPRNQSFNSFEGLTLDSDWTYQVYAIFRCLWNVDAQELLLSWF